MAADGEPPIARLPSSAKLQLGGSQIVEISRSTGQPGRPQGPDTFGGNSFSIILAPGDGRLFALLPGQGGRPPVTGQGEQSLFIGRRWRMILGR